MPTISQTPNELQAFIAAAEKVWFEVYDSADSRRVIRVDEADYYRLPVRFSTRAKVISYFRKYWGITMSNTMFCNLKTVSRNNRLYVISGDTGTISFIPRRLTVTGRTSTRIRLTAVLSIDDMSDEDIVNVRYLIGVSGNRLLILNRDQKNTDTRYQTCR